MHNKSFIPALWVAAWSFAFASFPTDTLAAGTLIAAYNFDEAAGSAIADLSGNNHAGTLVNGPSWTSGRYGGGLSFDGYDDFVTLGDIDQADGGTGITVSAWVKFAANGGGAGEMHLVDKSSCNGMPDNGPWELGVSFTQPHKAEFIVYARGATPAAYFFSGPSAKSIDDGNWHFVVGRYDGADLSIWVDGAQENATHIPGLTLSSNGNRVEFGGHCNGNNILLRGAIDDVRIYDGAQTQAEIQQDMTTPIGATQTKDSVSPNVALTSPTEGTTIANVISVSADASDNVAIAYVQFMLDGAPLGAADTASPYVLSWDTKSVSDGAHVLAAYAQDTAGNAKTSTALTVYVSNAPQPSPPPPVAPTPSVSLSAAPTSVASGASTVLTWSSLEATSCTASGAWSGTRATAGSVASGPLTAASNTFTLTCTGAGGSAGASAVVAVMPSNPAGTYSTNFDRTESPISEGGLWHRANNQWTSVRTSGGLAFGTNGAADVYDDSYALLAGFGPDQSATAVVVRSPNLANGVTHEVELLLRFSDDSGHARGYECTFAYTGTGAIVRWNGAMGDFTVMPVTIGSGALGRELVTGDVVKATVTGNVISVYINGTLINRAVDSAISNGQPGIGFFTRPGGNSANFALTSYSAASN